MLLTKKRAEHTIKCSECEREIKAGEIYWELTDDGGRLSPYCKVCSVKWEMILYHNTEEKEG